MGTAAISQSGGRQRHLQAVGGQRQPESSYQGDSITSKQWVNPKPQRLGDSVTVTRATALNQLVTNADDSVTREQGVDSVYPAGYTGKQAEHKWASLGYEAWL